MHRLAYGHPNIIRKAKSILEVPELFLMSFHEAKIKGLLPSQPNDPKMIKPRAPKTSIWPTRRKLALDEFK